MDGSRVRRTRGWSSVIPVSEVSDWIYPFVRDRDYEDG